MFDLLFSVFIFLLLFYILFALFITYISVKTDSIVQYKIMDILLLLRRYAESQKSCYKKHYVVDRVG